MALVQRVIVKSKAKSLNENYTHVINVIYVFMYLDFRELFEHMGSLRGRHSSL